MSSFDVLLDDERTQLDAFIEAHSLTPCIHFLPRAMQRALIRNFTIWGLITRPTAEQARAFIAHNLGQLSPEDQTIYRAKLDALSHSDVPSKDR